MRRRRRRATRGTTGIAWARALRRLLWLAVGVAALQYAVGGVLFLAFPDTELEGGVDAVVVLAGSVSRLPVAQELMEGGAARVLVVSDDRGTDEEDLARAEFCALGRHPYPVVCRRPNPFSTRGEARLAARLAADRGWGSIAVVTSRFHLFRARMLFDRCTDAALVMRGSDEPWYSFVTAVPSEWLKLVVAETTRRGC